MKITFLLFISEHPYRKRWFCNTVSKPQNQTHTHSIRAAAARKYDMMTAVPTVIDVAVMLQIYTSGNVDWSVEMLRMTQGISPSSKPMLLSITSIINDNRARVCTEDKLRVDCCCTMREVVRKALSKLVDKFGYCGLELAMFNDLRRLSYAFKWDAQETMCLEQDDNNKTVSESELMDMETPVLFVRCFSMADPLEVQSPPVTCCGWPW